MAKQPDKGGRDRPNARARSAALREAQRKKEKRQKMLTIGAISVVVLAVIGVIIGIAASGGGKKKASATRTPAPAAIVNQVATVPAADFVKAGTASVAGDGLKKIDGPALTTDGKPRFFYYGAEYCPFCATERWPVVVALSRFGKFSDLKVTASSATDTPASISTFSFYGAKYTSDYLAFESVETYTNQPSGGFYSTLETPTKEQSALVTKYDGANGSIPFLDFGNKYISSGATYDYSVLQGKSADEISADILDPTSAVSKGVLGAANAITAGLCEMTSGKPATVCDTTDMKKLRSALTSK
jgi:hypothetical protein